MAYKKKLESILSRFSKYAGEAIGLHMEDKEANEYIAQTATAVGFAFDEPNELSLKLADNAVKQLAATIKHARSTTIDPLTGLYNKYGIVIETDHIIARKERENIAVGIFYIDLTKFKRINDTLDHQEGDAALQLVAEKIKEVTRDSDVIAREGGDEFVVVITNNTEDHDFGDEKNKLQELFDNGIIYHGSDDIDYHIGGDMGLAIVADGESAKAAIKRADKIMFKAKEIAHRLLDEQNTPKEPTPT